MRSYTVFFNTYDGGGFVMKKKTAIKDLLEELSAHQVQLVAVTKNHSPEEIIPLYEMGLRDFGENRIQELVHKYESMPKDIRWHMIGHIQRKKLKKIIPFVHLVQSLDREILWEELDTLAARQQRILPALLEIKVAREQTKYGFSPEELFRLLESGIHKRYPNVRIEGVMGMASFSSDYSLVKKEFDTLQEIFQVIKSTGFFPKEQFVNLSMGMSMDYKIALEAGTTMVRIGSLLFN